MNDLMAGHIDIFFGTLCSATSLARADKVKMLAIADENRQKEVQIPTMSESALPRFVLRKR
ncbi:hypothetical protein [Pseudorhodoplanes sp.]|uniref:hypothetical protein n=1 Tax=Pseudorhodoplanes sp. TaxID=1934341 RepID=UPI003D09B212